MSALATGVVFVLSLLGGEVRAQSLSADLKAEGVDSLAKAARERGSAVDEAILFPHRHWRERLAMHRAA